MSTGHNIFITLEGIEGSGKTTQLGNIVSFLEGCGHDCLLTREPGGTRIGRRIRAILLDPASRGMGSLTEMFLYEADRAEHISKIIRPALAAGKTVISDRFCDATVVYQGYARGLDVEFIHGVHRTILNDLAPDVTILLDLPPEVGLGRAWNEINNGRRTADETRFEKETLAFHNKIRAGYLELARGEPERFCIIDAGKNEEQVRTDIVACLQRVLNASDGGGRRGVDQP